MKFVRRKELDVATRINILILALSCQGIYGARTALANQYNISRSFLYQLISVGLLCLQELFSNENISISSNRLEIDSNIALLRLEGSVSISGISEILKMQGYESNSTGMVRNKDLITSKSLLNLTGFKNLSGLSFGFYLILIP